VFFFFFSPQNQIVITVFCYVYDTYDSVAEKKSSLGAIQRTSKNNGEKGGLYFVVSFGKRSMFTLPSAIHSFLTSLVRSV